MWLARTILIVNKGFFIMIILLIQEKNILQNNDDVTLIGITKYFILFWCVVVVFLKMRKSS